MPSLLSLPSLANPTITSLSSAAAEADLQVGNVSTSFKTGDLSAGAGSKAGSGQLIGYGIAAGLGLLLAKVFIK